MSTKNSKNDWDSFQQTALGGIHYLEKLGSIQHNKFMAIICSLSIILLGVGLGSNEMTYGTIKYKERNTLAVKTIDYSIGMWSYNDNGVSGSTCSGVAPFPDSNSDICTAVRATRAFVFLAILTSAVGVVASIVRMLHTERYDAPMLTTIMLFCTAIFSMIAYSIWQNDCQNQFGEEFEERFYPNATNEIERRWSTVGYSYCFILWSWIWALTFIAVKLINPDLDNFGCCKKEAK